MGKYFPPQSWGRPLFEDSESCMEVVRGCHSSKSAINIWLHSLYTYHICIKTLMMHRVANIETAPKGSTTISWPTLSIYRCIYSSWFPFRFVSWQIEIGRFLRTPHRPHPRDPSHKTPENFNDTAKILSKPQTQWIITISWTVHKVSFSHFRKWHHGDTVFFFISKVPGSHSGAMAQGHWLGTHPEALASAMAATMAAGSANSPRWIRWPYDGRVHSFWYAVVLKELWNVWEGTYHWPACIVGIRYVLAWSSNALFPPCKRKYCTYIVRYSSCTMINGSLYAHTWHPGVEFTGPSNAFLAVSLQTVSQWYSLWIMGSDWCSTAKIMEWFGSKVWLYIDDSKDHQQKADIF